MPVLTDTAIRTARPTDKPRKLSDSGGLYLLIAPTGGKLWRMKYRFNGKEKTLAFGKYPEVPLKDARDRRDEARKLLANGADPAAVKKAQKAERQERAANNFEAVAHRWFEVWKAGVAEKTAQSQWRRLENHIFPFLGGVPVSEITPKKVIEALRPLEARGTGDTLRKSKTAINQILRFAIQNEWAQYNPVPDLVGAFKVTPTKHMAAITDPVKLGVLLRDIDMYHGSPSVCYALRLVPLVFVRPCELRGAKWAAIDLEKGEWKFFVGKTKVEHLVPLSRQAVAILKELHPITGHHRTGLVFPGQKPGRPLSNATINNALRIMGYDTQADITGHGFRATA
ncbi:MAG: integrase arm-type DNA-binding domain-containing protein, partial [Azoarcus sp.]|nr:integrase arm-type DNA-binding domain-containing protein [Azoarcus sp.]